MELRTATALHKFYATGPKWWGIFTLDNNEEREKSVSVILIIMCDVLAFSTSGVRINAILISQRNKEFFEADEGKEYIIVRGYETGKVT